MLFRQKVDQWPKRECSAIVKRSSNDEKIQKQLMEYVAKGYTTTAIPKTAIALKMYLRYYKYSILGS